MTLMDVTEAGDLLAALPSLTSCDGCPAGRSGCGAPGPGLGSCCMAGRAPRSWLGQAGVPQPWKEALAQPTQGDCSMCLMNPGRWGEGAVWAWGWEGKVPESTVRTRTFSL